MIDVWVPGVLRPAPRPRVANGRAYMPGWYGLQKRMMARELQVRCRPMPAVATSVELSITVGRPASHLLRAGTPRKGAPKWPPARAGDVDNLAKAVLDAMVDAGLLPDDAQVVRLLVTKAYAAPGQPVGLHLVASAFD